VVVLLVLSRHYGLLNRNLFYTGLTRATKLALIVGSTQAVAMAVRKVKHSRVDRNSYLSGRLKDLATSNPYTVPLPTKPQVLTAGAIFGTMPRP